MREFDPHSFEASSDNGGATVVQVDLGKHAATVVIAAIVCGFCLAATALTIQHSEAREVSTEAQMRKTQNHVDEMTNELKRLRDRLEDREHATR